MASFFQIPPLSKPTEIPRHAE